MKGEKRLCYDCVLLNPDIDINLQTVDLHFTKCYIFNLPTYLPFGTISISDLFVHFKIHELLLFF